MLLSAAAVLREDALRGNSQGATFDPWHLDKPYYTVPGRGLKIGRDYIQTAMNLPIYETTARYDGPALVINGMADYGIDREVTQRHREHATVNPQNEADSSWQYSIWDIFGLI